MVNSIAALATAVLFLVIAAVINYKHSNSKPSNTDTDKGVESTAVVEQEEEEYHVCEEHGHDFREYQYDGLTTEFVKPETGWSVERGIHKRVVPGQYLGKFHLLELKTAPCRDCPVEDSISNIIEERIVFEKDREVKTIAYSQYKQLKKGACEDKT